MDSSDRSELLGFLRTRQEAIADAWYEAVARTSLSHFGAAELRDRFGEMTKQIITLLVVEPFERREARALGASLAGLHLLSPETISKTQQVLARELVWGLGIGQAASLPPRLVALLSEVAAGFFEGARDMILDEQERIKTALLNERERAEEALRRSEASLAKAQRIARLGHWELDLDRDDLRWSEEIFRIFGSDKRTFGATLEAFLEYVHPDDLELVDWLGWKAAVEGEPSSFEHRIVRPDGEVRVVHQRVEAMLDSVGRPIKLLGTVQDVTERKEAEGALKESEERFRQLFEQAADALLVHDEDGRIVDCNAEARRSLGYSREEMLSLSVKDFAANLVSSDGLTAEGGPLWRHEVEPRGFETPSTGAHLAEHRRKDGTTFPVEVRVGSIDYGGERMMLASCRDVTEMKRAAEGLQESEERYRAVVEQSAECIFLFDPETKRVLESNTALQRLLDYTPGELLGREIYDFIAHDPCEIDLNVQRDLREKHRFGERKYRRKDGSLVDVEVSMSAIPYCGKEVLCTVARDVTERKELEERLRHRTLHDALTGLPNRTLFLDRLEHALGKTRREGGSVAVLMVDLDSFKLVNDSLGHDKGNALLVGFADRLRNSMRPGDTFARLFGDEFAILLESPTGAKEARQVAERIGDLLRVPFDLDGREVFVSASMGIALGKATRSEDQPGEILRHADLAMYAAKSRGKARYEVYDPSMNARAMERVELERDLHRAVEREEFEVYYQPMVCLESGKPVGFEALMRWEHPDKGLLPAHQFVLLAEEISLIDQIGLWILKESCRQLKEWQKRYPARLDLPLGLCVNLSARQIQKPDLIENIAGTLRETGLDPGCLMLEITERTAMVNAEQTIGKLRELKRLGVQLALDDFGTGYCSLVYLEHSLFDVLKIDRLFMHREKEDPEECAAVISAMINMAHSLDLEVIVEGIETEDQLVKLKEMRCDMAQGYYFAKPLPENEASEFMVTHTSRQPSPGTQ